MIENKFLTEEEIFEENINKITKEFEKKQKRNKCKIRKSTIRNKKRKK